MAKPRRYWMGTTPEKCDICSFVFKSYFVDGATKGDSGWHGMWGCMCVKCHRIHGIGLGTGRGQKYKKEANGVWYKHGG